MAKGNFTILMDQAMKENGNEMYVRDMEYMCIKTMIDTKEIGQYFVISFSAISFFFETLFIIGTKVKNMVLEITFITRKTVTFMELGKMEC